VHAAGFVIGPGRQETISGRHLLSPRKLDRRVSNLEARIRFRPGPGRARAQEEKMSDEAIVAQTGPYQVELTEGEEYWFCRCGRSKTQPFCDGSHEGTTIEPLRFTVDHTGTFNLCGCKATDDEPFCDGTHNIL
jgi:CDGSH-type Zn-finger protein